jgi:hypothetical protein
VTRSKRRNREREEADEEQNPAPLPDKAPSLVALAAAFEALDGAALQVRGVYEWIQRLGSERELRDEEASRLWAFAEKTREVADRVRSDADGLAQILLRQFVAPDGRWMLSEQEWRDLHEVLAALALSDAERHAGQTRHPASDPAEGESGG